LHCGASYTVLSLFTENRRYKRAYRISSKEAKGGRQTSEDFLRIKLDTNDVVGNKFDLIDSIDCQDHHQPQVYSFLSSYKTLPLLVRQIYDQAGTNYALFKLIARKK
jgi:hypothetical protein